MKKIKEEKGITLVALIITIVVLLILAIVGIGAIQDSKIIAHAQNAAGSFNQSKNNEVDSLINYEEEIEKYIPQAKEDCVKTGYYIHERVNDGFTQVWYIQDIGENKINIKYYNIKDDKVDSTIEFGEFSINEENKNKLSLTNYLGGPQIVIEPNYYVFEALGTKDYVKDKYLYVADNPGDDNPEYIEAILDEKFVLPQ